MLTRNWLLVFSAVAYALMSVVYFLLEQDGQLAFHSWRSLVTFLGELALAAAVCTIAAGLTRFINGQGWLLVLNGLAMGALGVIYIYLIHYRISFLSIALLVILMAITSGSFEFAAARTLWHRGNVWDGRLLGLAGVASVGFAVAFLALGLRWIRIEPGSHTDLLWLGLYFGFSAAGTLVLALRIHSQGRTGALIH